MVIFDLWNQAFAFFVVYSMLIILPCIYVAKIGHKMITELGRYPSRTPFIQMSIFSRLVAVEIVTFYFLIATYTYFSN